MRYIYTVNCKEKKDVNHIFLYFAEVARNLLSKIINYSCQSIFPFKRGKKKERKKKKNPQNTKHQEKYCLNSP